MTDTSQQQPEQQQIDLTNCDREPIHLLGGVQSYGCLIATSSDFMVKHVSGSVHDQLGLDPETTVGARLLDLLPEQTIHDLRTKLQLLNIENSTARLFRYDALGTGKLFDISVHALDQTYVFEFEPKIDTHARDEMSLVQPLLARVKRTDSVQDACAQAAMAMQALSGFDRVMVYRFHPDFSGEVVAEKRKPSMEPFLGLRYPASDIPVQARALYKRSMLRLIADVDGAVSAIHPATSIAGAPLDLSLAVTRAVSPIHLEYLRNMGVAASMSVSIMVDGELWGLFACHHDTPRYVDYERRTAIELFSQFFCYEISKKIEVEARQDERRTRRLHDNLMIQLSSGANLIDGFDVIADELAGLIESDGMAVYSNGQFAARGATPTEAEFHKLARFLNTAPAGEVYATDHLAKIYPDARDFSEDVAGVLTVPISRTPRDYIVFFRREIAKSVRWAGNPEKPAELGPNGSRLTPRKSFEAWSQVVRDVSAPWTQSEMNTAEALRVSLIEIVLKLTDEANQTRRKANDKQELLIAELNHRVRNILNLIQGLVSQSKEGATDISSFTKVLDGRIHALARAHDQLTRHEWAPASLRSLIEVEVNAYLNGEEGRLNVTGDAPLLKPEAFSTMALVVHELVTNSAKYGALTESAGAVSIDLNVAPDGALSMKWREIGGPPVKAPERRGFGTTIIEKTIPYELKGTVETRYLLSGFEADIMIPSKSLAPYQEQRIAPAANKPQSPVRNAKRLHGNVLVLEDNMVIAMDASDVLTGTGAANVHMASSVASALEVIGTTDLEFALIDVNLGDQTSLPVANVLTERGIPFVLATGYGDAQSITTAYPPAHLINKPFTAETLRDAVTIALDGRKA